MKPIVVIESPYKAFDEYTLQRNLAYARALVEHVTLRGGAPCASHLLITQALDDTDPAQRQAGIDAGLAMLRVADEHVFGVDFGISAGMQLGIDASPFDPELLSLVEWRSALMLGLRTPQLDTLIARYAPKWHVHRAST